MLFKVQNIFNKEAEIITALRSKTLRGIKTNFHTQYSDNLDCNLCGLFLDTQEHCMMCPKILNNIDIQKEHIKYEHIFGTIEEQKEVAILYLQLVNCREELLLKNADHGLRLDPVQI